MVKKYSIEVSETLCRVVEVEATTEAEAVAIVEQRYHKGKIVLDSGDFAGYGINEV